LDTNTPVSLPPTADSDRIIASSDRFRT
jgi:hypothetical protein